MNEKAYRDDVFSAPDLRKKVADISDVFRGLAGYSTQLNVTSHVADACAEAGKHLLLAQRILSDKATEIENRLLDSGLRRLER
jgi:hypothetical protein